MAGGEEVAVMERVGGGLWCSVLMVEEGGGENREELGVERGPEGKYKRDAIVLVWLTC